MRHVTRRVAARGRAPQIAVYGMNSKIGMLSFPPDDSKFDKPYSQETARVIDEEVRALVAHLYQRTLDMIHSKRDIVEKLALVRAPCSAPGPAPRWRASRCVPRARAQALLEKEVLGLTDLNEVLGKRPFRSAELRNIDRYAGARDPELPVAADAEEADMAVDEAAPPGVAGGVPVAG